jgi:serine/threonine-protein kinase RsbW
MKKKTFTFVLKNDLAELKDLCLHCEELGQSFGLSERFIFQTNLALDELFTNIVTYGFKDKEEHRITINITVDQKALTLCIEDDGVPFDPIHAPEPDLTCSMEDAKVGGLGIHLIKNIMDEIKYSRVDGKNVLHLTKYLCASKERKSRRA